MLMQRLSSKVETDPPRDPIHLPDPECPFQRPKPHASPPLDFSNLHPSPCSVACADLTLCSLPSNRKSCSLQSKIHSSTPLSFSRSHLMRASPAHTCSVLLLHHPCANRGPNAIPPLTCGAAPCPIALPIPHGGFLRPAESEMRIPGGLVGPGQVAVGTHRHGAASQRRKFWLAK